MLFPIFNNYEEIEIQSIVSRLFEMRGYNVRHQHLIERSREKGADLIASKTGEIEKIAIQVKKKPSGTDINQLRELAERSEKIKKYVYIEEPSTDFSDAMEGFSKRIDFWNGEKLITEILSVDPYLALLLLVSDTQTARYLSWTRDLLLESRNETENKKLEDVKLEKPTKEMLQLLWQAKDRACSIGKGLSFMANVFNQTDRESSALTTKDVDYTAKTFVRAIALYAPEGEQLFEFFLKMKKQFRGYIEYACIERRIGSEWIHLMQFWFLLPGCIETTFRLWKKDERRTENMVKKLPLDDLSKDVSIFDAMHHLSIGIAKLGTGTEGIIDDIWRYALDNSWKQHNSKE